MAGSPTREQILLSLSILVKCQTEATKKGVLPQDSRGVCLASKEDGIEVFSLDYIKGSDPISEAQLRAVAVTSSARYFALGERTVCSPDISSCRQGGEIVVDLDSLSEKNGSDPEQAEDETKPSASMTQTNVEVHQSATNEKCKPPTEMVERPVFPLPVDDYFMAVAILSKELCKDNVAACIVSNESLHVYSIGLGLHPELNALRDAKKSRVNLTKCSLYTTKRPSLHCTMAIIQAGIRVVVYGSDKGLGDIEGIVYQAKACFKEYKCHLRLHNEKKKFTIDLSKGEVIEDKYYPQKVETSGLKTPDKGQSKQILTRTDFFMAMAFLSSTRSKDGSRKVGACLVTPAPDRLVAMGYNGMPDGRGFHDANMDWDEQKANYVCHAEVNAVIAAFRREADLSDCTLYTTLSPCDDCSKLVAQSGIKNLVFAKYYKGEGEPMHETLKSVNIKKYAHEKNSTAKITIDLTTLDIKLENSTKEPEEDVRKPKIRDDVDFPKDDYFMALAVLAKSQSPFKQSVGACIVYQEPHRPISVGCNGFVDGLSDGDVCCAEFNAIVSAFRYHADLTSATLYTTGIPCSRCATKIVQSGIKTVVYGGKISIDSTEVEQMEPEAEKIFYWGKVATLIYKRPTQSCPYTTKSPIIEIDLQGLVTEQRQNA